MKKILALVLAALLLVSMVACAPKSAEEEAVDAVAEAVKEEIKEEKAVEEAVQGAVEDAVNASDLAYVAEKGTLVVGITDFAPMDYQDESGKWIGFDADAAEAFAASLGVEAEFVEIDWDNKILELDGKTIDCVWNGMTLTDEVTTAMDCSVPYCNNYQVVVVPAANAEKFATVEDMKDLVFAVEAGSAGEAEANKLGVNVTPVKDQATALMEVAAGSCDAAVIDALMAGAMVGEGTGYEDLTYTIGLNEEEGEQYGVGFRKGSDLPALLDSFFGTAYADGSLQTIAETYGIQAALIAQ